MAIKYNYNIDKITAAFFEVEGGNSSQFLKADGTVDNNSYITTEVNDLTAVVTWDIVPNAYISESSVTQHESALTITQSQISDFNGIGFESLSVTTNPASGGGSLSYDNLGTFTYTPPFPTLDSVTINGNSTTNTVLVGSLGVGTGITFPSELIEVAGNIEAVEFIGQLRGPVLFKAKSGEDLLKGDVVYISGISGQTTVVSKADANDPAKMPAFGLVSTDSTNNTACEVVTFGTLSGVDTDAYTEGEELYVSTTPGAMVSSPPTGEASQVQKIAKVTRSAQASGSLKVMGAGRTNAVPNLNNGNVFIGSALNQAETRQLVESDISDFGTYLTDAPSDGNPYARQDGSWTQVVTNELNDLTASVTWANVPDANITQTSVTQHQSALSITESQISDFGTYLTTETDPVFSASTVSNIIDGTGRLQNDGLGNWSYDNNTYLTSFTEVNDLSTTVTWANVPDANITESSVTQHLGDYKALIPVSDPATDYIISVYAGPTTPGSGYDYTFTDIVDCWDWLNENANFLGTGTRSGSKREAKIQVTLEGATFTEALPDLVNIRTEVEFIFSSGTKIDDNPNIVNCKNIRLSGSIVQIRDLIITDDSFVYLDSTTYYGGALYVYENSTLYHDRSGTIYVNSLFMNDGSSFYEKQSSSLVLGGATGDTSNPYNWNYDGQLQALEGCYIRVNVLTQYSTDASTPIVLQDDSTLHVIFTYNFNNSGAGVDAAFATPFRLQKNSKAYLRTLNIQTPLDSSQALWEDTTTSPSTDYFETDIVIPNGCGVFLMESSPTSKNIVVEGVEKIGGLSTEFLKADGSVDSSTYLTTATASSTYQALSEKGSANGYASLDANGKVPTTQVPALALTEVSVVADQAARLALTAQEGDVAIQTDTSTTYIHNGGTAGTNADWEIIEAPVTETDPVFTSWTLSGTSYNITDGTGFLKNNGSGVWSYDNNTYYLASNPNNYADDQTLDEVTTLGNTTTNAITVGNLTSTGIDDNATSTAITIDANENVGIGTAPATKLHMATTGADFCTLRMDAANTTAASYSLRSHDGVFDVRDNTASAIRLTLDANGNVGINVVDPDERLEVAGDIKSSVGGNAGVYHFGGTSDQTKITGRDSSHPTLPDTMELATGGSTRLTIDSNGNVGIGTADPKEKLHVVTASNSLGTVADASADELVLENTGDVGMTLLSPNTATQTIAFGDTDNRKVGWIDYDHSTNAMEFATLGSPRMTILENGNVGIGEDSPDNALHVKDTTNIVAKLETTHASGNSRLVFKPSSLTNGWNIGANDNGAFTIYNGDTTTTPLSINSNDDITILGDLTLPRLRLTAVNDLSLSSTLHAFQIGPDNGTNVAIDGNEIMARNNGVASPLFLNLEGGVVSIGGQLQVSSTNGLRQQNYQTATNTFTVTAAAPTRYVRLGLVPPGNARLRVTWTGNSGYNNFVADFSTQFKSAAGSNGEDTTVQVQTVYSDSGNSEFRHLYFEYVNSQSAYVWALVVNPGSTDQTYYTHLEGNFTDTTTLNWGSPTVNAANFNASAPTANPAAIYKNGKVLIGSDDTFNTTPTDPLQVSNPTALGSTLYDTQPLQTWTGSNGNVGYLELFQYRHTAGSTWTQASTRLQHKIDSTYQGYIQFNGPGNNYGVSLGYGAGTPADPEDAVDGLLLDTSGNVEIPVGNLTVSSGSLSATGATLTGLSAQASEATALMINGSNVVGTRELGSNAFNSTAFLTANQTITLSGDVTGSGTTSIVCTVGNDTHTHAFDNLTGKTAGTGEYATTSNLIAGQGSGSIAMTINDGYGNSNLTFNHRAGTPDNSSATQSACRIETTTDSNTGSFSFEIGNSTVQNTPVALTQVMYMTTGLINAKVNLNAEAGLDVTGDVTTTGTITSTVASNDDVLRWSNTGYLKRLTTQGGFFLGGDSSGIIHAGDQESGLRTALGITDATTTESIYLVADSTVQIRTNWQDVGNNNDRTWTFGSNGNLSAPGTISATGATLTGLSAQASEATALVINGSNVVGTRELGSNAFNSTSYLPLTGGSLTNNLSLVGSSAGSNNVLRFYVGGTEYGQIFGGSNQGMLFYGTAGNGFSFRPNASATSVFDITSSIAESAVTMQVSNTAPILKLNDTNATNTTNLSGWVGFYANGTERGYVGYGSGATNILYLSNYDGPVHLSSAGTGAKVQVNSDLDVTGNVTATGATFTGLSAQASEATALVINGSNVVGTRELGSNAFNSTAYLTGNQTITLSGDVTGSGTTAITCTVVNDSHTHDTRYFTETEADARFTSIDHFRAISTRAYTSTTTVALFETEMLADDYFDSYLAAGKASWSYAGNADLTDAGNLTELAGCSFLTWTDTSADNTLGTYTALVIAPNTGGSAYRTMIYNDQGDIYSPGWREILTDKTYNDFVPSLTGTGASGSWGISVTGSSASCTGNAATATQALGAVPVQATGVDDRDKIRVWTDGTYGFGMGSAYTYGALNDFAITTQMSNTADRGFWWGDTGHTNAQGAMSLTTEGQLTVASNISVGWGQSHTADPVAPLDIRGTGRSVYISGFTQTTMATATSALGAIEIVQDTASHDSFMTFHVSNDYALYFGLDGATNRLGWGGWSAGANKYQIASMGITNTGDFSATGNVTAYASDERLKENIKPIENALDKLHNISGVTFDWTDESEQLGFIPSQKKNDAGVIAQRVQEVLPQAVVPAPFDLEMNPENGKEYSKTGKDYLTVQYEKIVPLLIEAIKEQQKQIDELKEMLK